MKNENDTINQPMTDSKNTVLLPPLTSLDTYMDSMGDPQPEGISPSKKSKKGKKKPAENDYSTGRPESRREGTGKKKTGDAAAVLGLNNDNFGWDSVSSEHSPQAPVGGKPKSKVNRSPRSPLKKKNFNYSIYPRPTETTPGVGGVANPEVGFGKAIESIAALKLHNYAAKRKDQMNQKIKLLNEIREFQYESPQLPLTEEHLSPAEVLAAWKLRYYIELFRCNALKRNQAMVERRKRDLEEKCEGQQRVISQQHMALDDFHKKTTLQRATLEQQTHLQSQHTTEINSLKEQNHELSTRLQALDAELALVEGERGQLLEENQRLVGQELALSQELKLTRSTCQELVRSLAVKDNTIEDLQGAIGRKEREFDAKREREEEEFLLTLERAQMSAEDVFHFEQSHSRDKQQTRGVLDQKDSIIHAQQEKFIHLDQKAALAAQHIAQLHVSIANEQSRTEGVRQEKAGLEKIMLDLAVQMKEKEGELASKTERLLELQDEVKMLDYQLQDHQQIAQTLEDKASTAESQKKQLSRDLAALRRSLEGSLMNGEEQWERRHEARLLLEHNEAYTYFLEEELQMTRKLLKKIPIPGLSSVYPASNTLSSMVHSHYGTAASYLGGESGVHPLRVGELGESVEGEEGEGSQEKIESMDVEAEERGYEEGFEDDDEAPTVAHTSHEQAPGMEGNLMRLMELLEHKIQNIDLAAAHKGRRLSQVSGNSQGSLLSQQAEERRAAAKQQHVERHLGMEASFVEMENALATVQQRLAEQKQWERWMMDRRNICIANVATWCGEFKRAVGRDPEDADRTPEVQEQVSEFNQLTEGILFQREDDPELEARMVALKNELFLLDDEMLKSEQAFANLYGESIVIHFPPPEDPPEQPMHSRKPSVFYQNPSLDYHEQPYRHHSTDFSKSPSMAAARINAIDRSSFINATHPPEETTPTEEEHQGKEEPAAAQQSFKPFRRKSMMGNMAAGPVNMSPRSAAAVTNSTMYFGLAQSRDREPMLASFDEVLDGAISNRPFAASPEAPVEEMKPVSRGRLGASFSAHERAHARIEKLREELDEIMKQLDQIQIAKTSASKTRATYQQQIISWNVEFTSLCGYQAENVDKMRSDVFQGLLAAFNQAQEELKELHFEYLRVSQEATEQLMLLVRTQDEVSTLLKQESQDYAEQYHIPAADYYEYIDPYALKAKSRAASPVATPNKQQVQSQQQQQQQQARNVPVYPDYGTPKMYADARKFAEQVFHNYDALNEALFVAADENQAMERLKNSALLREDSVVSALTDDMSPHQSTLLTSESPSLYKDSFHREGSVEQEGVEVKTESQDQGDEQKGVVGETEREREKREKRERKEKRRARRKQMEESGEVSAGESVDSKSSKRKKKEKKDKKRNKSPSNTSKEEEGVNIVSSEQTEQVQAHANEDQTKGIAHDEHSDLEEAEALLALKVNRSPPPTKKGSQLFPLIEEAHSPSHKEEIPAQVPAQTQAPPPLHMSSKQQEQNPYSLAFETAMMGASMEFSDSDASARNSPRPHFRSDDLSAGKTAPDSSQSTRSDKSWTAQFSGSNVSKEEMVREYARLKRQLRRWKRKFKEENGRDPGMIDFPLLDAEVKRTIARKNHLRKVLGEDRRTPSASRKHLSSSEDSS